MAGPARAADGYFENVWELRDRGTEFCLTVGRVLDDSAARRAGLRSGDRIVGVDGLRVRSPAEYMFMRYYYDARPDITLTVLRRDSLIDVPIRHPVPIRRSGFSWRNPYSKHYELLLQWNIELDGGRKVFLDAQVGDDKKETTVTGLLDAFGVRQPRLVSQAGRLLPLFPARGWEALTRTMVTEREKDRESGEALLNAYLHLRFGERGKASGLLAKMRLPETAPDVFLRRLAGFYERVCKSPPNWGTPKIWEAYGVDLPFFVACYPYPVVPEKGLTGSFGFDPEFQAFFDQATAGVWVDWEKIRTKAMKISREGASGDKDTIYLGQVKAALLDPRNHGGWPFRSPVVRVPDGRETVLKKLAARLDEKPEERVLTALAMLCPAVLSGDLDQFKSAYSIVFGAGPRERACAAAMVGAERHAWEAESAFREFVAELEEQEDRPAFYDYVLSASPAFRYRARTGSYYRHDHGVVGLEDWAGQGLQDVARALESPLELDFLDEICDPNVTQDPGLRGKAFRMLTRELARCPTQPRMVQFIRLAKVMPPGNVLDAAGRVFGYHCSLGVGGQVSVDELFPECFDTWEAQHYGEVVSELATTDMSGPELVKRAEAIFTRAGTPSICLALASRLSAGGEIKAAEYYSRKVVDFYESLASGYTGYGHVHLRRRAYRDLVSVPGFRVDAAEHRERVLIRPLDSDHVLAAVDDFHAGKMQGVIEHLQKSIGDEIRKGRGTFIFDGKILPDVSALRRALLCRTISGCRLTSAQITALAGLKGVDMAAVLADLRKTEAAAAKGPVRFAVDLLDGSTVVGVPGIEKVLVKTSYADIPLPLTKIRSITFRDDRRIADVQLRNGDVLNGIVTMGVVKLKNESGTTSVQGKNIKLIALHKSQIDRFRALVMGAKAGKTP